MSYVITFQGVVGQVVGQGDSVPIGSYLKSYNPEAAAGLGDAVWTGQQWNALKFNTFEEAFECWTQVPKSRPLREDGKPNRPLTAFNVEIVGI